MSKIKAIDPKIIVNRDVDRPYYSIEYYDTSDNQWHIGYGSYELKNVIEWLDTDFDVIKADVAPVKHGHWIYKKHTKLVSTGAARTAEEGGAYVVKKRITVKVPYCSICGERGDNALDATPFCPNCGARMDGDTDA